MVEIGERYQFLRLLPDEGAAIRAGCDHQWVF